MSSVAVSAPADLSSFSAQEALAVALAGTLSSSVRAASALEARPAPAMVPFGIDALDALTGGIPRGALTELFGPASSGRTSVMLSLLASITRRQEVCALIDVTDSFDPASGEAAGIDLKRLLWVRCGNTVSSFEFPVSKSPASQSKDIAATRSFAPPDRQECLSHMRPATTMRDVAPPAKNISWSIHQNYDARLRHAITGGCYEMGRGRTVSSFEFPVSKPPQHAPLGTRNWKLETRNPASKWTKLDQALKATDLLLQSGGFGLIAIDLGDISIEQARRIPLTSWFRFRRVVENTPTILLLVACDSCAKTCASLVLQLEAQRKTVSSFEFPVSSTRTQPKGSVRSSKPEIGNAKLETRNCLPHVNLLDGLTVHVELVRTRLERKPVRSTGTLETQTSWRKSG
jgi:hypothetical protein